jgi:hypothetical protein
MLMVMSSVIVNPGNLPLMNGTGWCRKLIMFVNKEWFCADGRWRDG